MLQIFGALFLLCLFINLVIFLWDVSPLIIFGLAGLIAYGCYKSKDYPPPTSFENFTALDYFNLYLACKSGDKSHPLYQNCKYCLRRKNCKVSPLQARVEKILASLREPPPNSKIRRHKHSHSSGANPNASNFGNYSNNYYGYDYDDDFDADDNDYDYDADADSDADSPCNYWVGNSNSGSDSGGGDSGGGDSGGGDN